MKTVYQVIIDPKELPDFQIPEARWAATFIVNGKTYCGAIYAPSIMVAMTRFYESTAKAGAGDTAFLTGIELSPELWKLRHVLECIPESASC